MRAEARHQKNALAFFLVARPNYLFTRNLNIELGMLGCEVVINKTPDPRPTAEPSEAKPERQRTDRKFWLIKNKTPVISRSFNHQSKNEQF